MTAGQPPLPTASSTLGIRPDEEARVFHDEPWEVHAFGLTLMLHEQGLFTWPESTSTLAAENKHAQAAGDPDTGETYYHHWFAALERFVTEQGSPTG
jgi:nitrile hydratase accessory protein